MDRAPAFQGIFEDLLLLNLEDLVLFRAVLFMIDVLFESRRVALGKKYEGCPSLTKLHDAVCCGFGVHGDEVTASKLQSLTDIRRAEIPSCEATIDGFHSQPTVKRVFVVWDRLVPDHSHQ